MHLARGADELGCGALLLDASGQDVASSEGRCRDPFVLLGALAASTARIRLAAITSPSPRHASMLAKTVSSLDVLADGRAAHCFAPGLADGADALGQLREAIEVCWRMFHFPAASFDGRYESVREAHNEPRPRRPTALGLVLADAGSFPQRERSEALAALAADRCDYAVLRLVDAPGEHACQCVRSARRALGDAWRVRQRAPGPVPLVVWLDGDGDPQSAAVRAAARRASSAGAHMVLVSVPAGLARSALDAAIAGLASAIEA